MIRRPPRSTLFPTRRSSDLGDHLPGSAAEAAFIARPQPRSAVGAVEDQVALAPRAEERARRISERAALAERDADRKSTRLNSSHANISYAVFCLKKKKYQHQ